MSVLLNFLKNLKKEVRGKGVFPGLKTEIEKRRKIYVSISVGIVLITILVAVGVEFAFLFSKFLFSKKNFMAYLKPEASVNKTVKNKEITKKTIRKELKKDGLKTKEKTIRVKKKKKKKVRTSHKKKLRRERYKKNESKRKRRVSDNFYRYYVLGDKYFRQGDLIKSMFYYEKALKLKADLDIVNNLVIIYTKLDEFKKAEKLIENFPDSRVIYAYLIELVKKGWYLRVKNIAEKYKKYDKIGYIPFALGYMYESMGNFKKALEYYRRAYQKNPLNPYFALNYARLLEMNGKYLKAYTIYRNIKTDNENIKKLAKSRMKELKIFIR